MKKNPDSRTFGLILVVIAVLFFGFFGHDMLYFFSLLAEVDIFCDLWFSMYSVLRILMQVIRTIGVLLLLGKIMREKKVSGTRVFPPLYVGWGCIILF